MKLQNIQDTIKNTLASFKKEALSRIKISVKLKIELLEQLSNLVHSGIPILNSFKIIKLQTKNKSLKKLLDDILSQLNKGGSLKESLERYPKIFGYFDLAIIEMWEVTGKLADAIETIKNKEEKNKELKWKILWALIYPMVIISLSVGMIGIFMIYVIPKIQKMYKDAQVNLPELTQGVINISNFLQANILEICLGIILFIILSIVFKNHPKTKYYYDMIILKIPFFGELIRKKILALFSNSLGTLLENGVIINTSLEISSRALENKYYEKELKKIIAGVSKGMDLSRLMWVEQISSGKENKYFPIELASVVKIWEQTGKMAHLLIKISQKFNKELDTIIKNMQTAIEPMVIIWVWIIVGTIIMAIMLPFFNMVNVI